MNNKDTKVPERIRLVKREGRFANEWYYPDAAIMPFEKEFQYARVDPPAAPTDPVLATLMKACPICNGPFNACDCSPLVVTRNGIPCEDQKAALEEFKQACAPPAPDEADKAVAQQAAEEYLRWHWYGGDAPWINEVNVLTDAIWSVAAQARKETWGKAVELVNAVHNDNDLDDGGFFEAGFIAARTKVVDALIEAREAASKQER